MSAKDRLLAALREHGCRVSASGTASTCPAHEDRAPSLSIGQRDDREGVVIRCHAGCATPDVLAALGWSAGDLFDRPRQRGQGRAQVVARYPYVDELGTVLYEKVRLDPKDFRQRHPDGSGGWSWSLGDAPRVLYRAPEVVAAVAAGLPVYVCEGEKDADAIAETGATATTWTEGAWRPGQAAKWRPGYTLQLRGARVVVIRDRDDAGRHTAASIARELAGSAASVTVVEPAEGKDAADHLAAGKVIADLVPVELDDTEPAPLDAPHDDAPHADKPADDKRSVATQLVELALSRWRFGISTEGEPFALPATGAQVVRMLTGSRSLRAELADVFQAETGKVATAQALTDAVLVLEGRARRTEPAPLALRVAYIDRAAWLDLGDLSGRAVKVTPTGWHLEDAPPILFRRTALSGVLPDPVRGGDLAELWHLVNVAPESRPVLLAWLVAALLPDLPHPIAALVGEQGTGKSTASRMLAGLLDPSPAQLRKPPRDVEQWVTAASGSWLVGVDNISAVADWWSDALCRAVTGDGDVRRRLYSDADLTVFAFRRVVLVNGIDLGAVRDDLAERLLTVELRRITDRRYDADLSTAWQDAHPRVLGALLDLAAQVLDQLPAIRLAEPPRMADFARVLAAVDKVLGTTGLATYTALAGDLAADAVSADPVLSTIETAITEPWAGTAADLLDLLGEGTEHGKAWPKNARALTTVLRRRAPSLRRLGWTVDDLGRQGKACALRFLIEPPTGAARQATASDSTREASDNACPASDSTRDACQSAPPPTCEDAEKASKASKASDRSPSLVPWASEESKETPPYVKGPKSSLASLATLADRECPTCGTSLDLAAPKCSAASFHGQAVLS